MFIEKPIDGSLELGIVGEEGMAVFDYERSRVRVSDAKGLNVCEHRLSPPPEIAKVSHRGMLYYQYKNVLDDLDGKLTQIAGADAAYWATLTAIAGEISAAEKRTVPIRELHSPRE